MSQALLQIVYWWHPLLWLANSRIRNAREEAVDDAVMTALEHEGDECAPTILEVAKLALGRPRLSLGLVGILESRGLLKRRIERLTHYRRPRKPGLTAVSSICVMIFGAVALPMGQGPVRDFKANSAKPAEFAEETSGSSALLDRAKLLHSKASWTKQLSSWKGSLKRNLPARRPTFI
jgi:beta-lactamase regulating signal transducer with metallopeptidase domain